VSSIIFHLDKNFDAIYIYYLDKIFAIIYIYHLQWKFRYLAKHWYKHKPYEQKYVVAFRNPIQPNVQATTHSCQFTPVQTQNYTIKHMKIWRWHWIVIYCSPLTLLRFFLTNKLPNFSQTHFVERVMSFVLGNTNTPFPPCFI